MKTKKTQYRLSLFDKILEYTTNKRAYAAMNYTSYNESRIKQSLKHFLVEAVKDFHIENGADRDHAEKAAYEEVYWEGTPNQTIPGEEFFGCKHRPDFMIMIDNNRRIAVEVKIGGTGESLRAGLGQAIVYSQIFDFVIYLFIDINQVNKYLTSM